MLLKRLVNIFLNKYYRIHQHFLGITCFECMHQRIGTPTLVTVPLIYSNEITLRLGVLRLIGVTRLVTFVNRRQSSSNYDG